MISDFERDRSQYPTPQVLAAATAPADAAQSLVDARKAENEGRPEEAKTYFADALALVEASVGTSSQAPATAAAARAGLARLLDGPAARSMRAAALEWLAVADPKLADGADLADHASLLRRNDPKRRALLRQAASRFASPVWVASGLIDDADPETAARLAWVIARHAPSVAGHHAQLADRTRALNVFDSRAVAGELAVAAGLFLRDDAVAEARRVAEDALILDSSNVVATLVLADALRLEDEPGLAIELLGSLQARLEPGSSTDRIAAAVLARAHEADGTRRDALRVLDPVLDDGAAAGDWVLAGRLHTALGEQEAARAAFDRAISIAPAMVSVVYASLVDWLRREQYEKAAVDVERALERLPQEPALHVLRGFVALCQNAPGAPDEQIDRAVLLGMAAPEAWNNLWWLCQDNGYLIGADLAIARQIETGDGRDANALTVRAELLGDLGRREEALTLYRRAARLRPGNGWVQQRLAQALFYAGRYDDALSVLERALDKRRRPPFLTTFLQAWRGRVHRVLGDLVQAERDLTPAVDEPVGVWAMGELYLVLAAKGGLESANDWVLDTMTAEQTSELALHLWDEVDTGGALALVEATLDRTEPENPSALANLLIVRGMGLWQADDHSGAEGSLRRAVELLSGDAMTHVFLGIYLAEMGDPDEAEAELTMARILEPGSDDVAARAIRALSKARGDARALEELDRAMFQIGRAPRLLILRAELLRGAGRNEEALAVITDLHRTSAETDDLVRIEGLVLADLGRNDEAIGLLREALVGNPSDLEVRVSLAISMVVAGNDADAIDDLRAAVLMDPGYHPARVALVEAAVGVGAVEEAEEHLHILVASDDLTEEPEIVRLAWVLDHPDLALERADRIIAAVPDSVQTLVLKAGILLERDDIDSAVDATQMAVSLDSSHVMARYMLSVAQQAKGALPDALLALGEDRDPLLVLQRVHVLLGLGRAAAAVEEIERALTRNEHEGHAAQVSDFCAALSYEVLEPLARLLTPRLGTDPAPDVLQQAGLVLSGMGDFRRAARVLELARKTDPDLAGIDGQLAWAYSNLKPAQPRAALECVRRALEKEPEDPYLLKAKADALLQAGLRRRTDAVRLYGEVLDRLSAERLPDDQAPDERVARGMAWLAGWCNYRLGSYELAVDHLLRSVASAPAGEGGDRFDLGLVLLVSGHASRARREYDEAVDQVRSSTDRLKARGLVQVALVDLDEAATKVSTNDKTVAREVRALLTAELKNLATATAGEIRPFLRRVDSVTRQR